MRRDREFIVEHYPGATFPDGTPLRFPAPVLRTRRYDLDAAHPGPRPRGSHRDRGADDGTIPSSAYERGAAETSQQRTLAGLLQSAVLKRFESCWAACLATIDRMIEAHEAFLASWDAGQVPSLSALRDVVRRESAGSDLTQWLDDVSDDRESRPVTDFEPDLPRARRSRPRPTPPGTRPSEPAISRRMTRNWRHSPMCYARRPVRRSSLPTYGETIAISTSTWTAPSERPGNASSSSAATPIPMSELADLPASVPIPSWSRGTSRPAERSTYSCRQTSSQRARTSSRPARLMSYDMPWNPQRVVQRNGRVIRLLSPHEEVQLTTMLPTAGDLDELLHLEARITAKIAAAGVFGMESGVIEGDETEQRVYADLAGLAERLEDGDTSLLSEEDDAGGAFAGEELRALLLRAFTEGELGRLRALPWGVGAAFRQGPGVPSRGPAGTFFACRTSAASGNQRYWRLVTTDGEVIGEELLMLRTINPGAAAQQTTPADMEDAWRTAVADIISEHNRRADPALADERLPPSQRFALSLLRDPSVALPTGAEEADELLTVPRGSAVRTALSDVQRRVAARELSRDQAAQAVVAITAEYGLTPVEPPPPLKPITEEDVGVVCWMQVLSASP